MDLTSSTTSAVSWMAAGPIGALRNPLLAALVVTGLMLLVFSSVLNVKGTWRQYVKASLYAYLAAAVVLGLHYFTLQRGFTGGAQRAERVQTFDEIYGGASSGVAPPSYHVPVRPHSGAPAHGGTPPARGLPVDLTPVYTIPM